MPLPITNSNKGQIMQPEIPATERDGGVIPTERLTQRDGNEIPEHRRAPVGHIWKCMACGKTAEDQYGYFGKNSAGWDESCVLNCVAVKQ